MHAESMLSLGGSISWLQINICRRELMKHLLSSTDGLRQRDMRLTWVTSCKRLWVGAPGLQLMPSLHPQHDLDHGSDLAA